MSRQIEATIAEAAAKNLRVSATIEWLVTHHHKSREQAKNRILCLLI